MLAVLQLQSSMPFEAHFILVISAQEVRTNSYHEGKSNGYKIAV